ncbi:hypothetical protein vseg_007331 [Gypsophila vaccaria]
MAMYSCNSSALFPFTEKATSLSELHQAHAHLLKTGLINDTYAASRLVAFAATNPTVQNIVYAHSVFSEIHTPNSFVWNSMIRAYANSAIPETALSIFSRMLESTVAPDKYTYPFVVKACSAFGGIKEGQQVHAHVVKRKVIREDVYVQNTLISMYANAGFFELAGNLLDRMLCRDVISWNAMLSAYVEKGMMELAQALFDEMEERNVQSWNFMVSGYVNSGLIDEARRVFDDMPVKDVVSWNAIISGYRDSGSFNEVLTLFERMLSENMKPDSYTLVNVLSACANLGALNQGKWIHLYIEKNRITIRGFLATALVDMYSKCGEIEKGLEIFDNTLEKDVSTWNSIIGGLSINGHGEKAVRTFHQMLQSDYQPNEITFINVLCSCSHAGLLQEGLEIFEQMINRHKIKPTIEHYGCMVDLLSRIGLLSEAKEFLQMAPLRNSNALWQSLLSSCRSYGKLELAREVAEKLMELDPDDNSGYVQLSNVYASTGRWERVAEVRRSMRARGLRKEAGSSLIEIDGVVHEFLAGEGLVPGEKNGVLTID